MKSFVGTMITLVGTVAVVYVVLQRNSGLNQVVNSAVVDYGKVSSVFRTGPGVG